MNTAHPVAPEEVMAFLDGELSAPDTQAISAHVDHCAECTNVAEQFRCTSRSLSRWRVAPVPAKLEQSVRDLADKTRLGLKIGKPGLFVRASFWTCKQWMFSIGSAAAALLFLIGLSKADFQRSHLVANKVNVAAGPLSVEVRKGLSLATQSGTNESSSHYSRKLPTAEFGTEAAVRGGLPLNGRSGGFDKLVTQASPGAAADSNGVFHGLGDHVQNSFRVDGQPGPMIARTVALSIVVKDFAASRSSLDAILARHHGYSAQLSVATPENAPRSIQASLRIPANELMPAVADLKTIGRVENESQSGEEVTQQHTDLVARLKNSRETEQRFHSILQQRTGNVVEVLQVEEGIARVRSDIERMEAEQKALEHRVDFTTVELQLSEEYKAQLNPPAPSVSIRVHNSFVAGYHNASETVLGILLFFAEYGLTLLLWLVILVLPVIFVRRRYRKALATV